MFVDMEVNHKMTVTIEEMLVIEKVLVNVRNAAADQRSESLENEIEGLKQSISEPLVVMTAVVIQEDLAQKFGDLQCVEKPFEAITTLVAQEGYRLENEIKKLKHGTVEQNEAIAGAILDGLIQQEAALVSLETATSLDCSDQAKRWRKYFTYNLHDLFWWVCRRDCPKTLSRLLAAFDLDVDMLHRYKCKDERNEAPIGPQQFFVRKYKKTCLHVAVKYRHPEIIKQLVGHGADVDARISAGFFYGKSHYSKIYMRGSLLFIAIILRDVELLQGLLEQGADLHAKAEIIYKPTGRRSVKERCPLTLLLICHWHWDNEVVVQKLRDMIMLLVKFGARIPNWADCDTSYMNYQKLLDLRLEKVSAIQQHALVQRSHYVEKLSQCLTTAVSTVFGLYFPPDLNQLIMKFSCLGETNRSDYNQSIRWQRKANQRIFSKQLTDLFESIPLTRSLPRDVISLIAQWAFINSDEESCAMPQTLMS